jgi:hypothetical protein
LAACQNGGLSGVLAAVRNALAHVQRELAAGTPLVAAVRAADLRVRHTDDGRADVGA